jgi:hypothetical protein
MKAILFNSEMEIRCNWLIYKLFLFNSNSEIPNYCNNNKSETPLVGGVKSRILSLMQFGNKSNKK